MSDINKYLSDEKVNEVIDSFGKIIDSRNSAKLPVYISWAVLASIAAFVCLRDTVLFGVLLFLCLSPIFIFAVGAFSICGTLKRMLNGVSMIFRTAAEVSLAVYNDRKAKNSGVADMKDTMIYSFNNILLPILGTAAKRKLSGKIILKAVEFVLKTGMKDFYKIIRAQVFGGEASDSAQADFSLSAIVTADGFDKTASKAVNKAVALFKTLGVLFLLTGILLTAVLLTVHAFVRF